MITVLRCIDVFAGTEHGGDPTRNCWICGIARAHVGGAVGSRYNSDHCVTDCSCSTACMPCFDSTCQGPWHTFIVGFCNIHHLSSSRYVICSGCTLHHSCALSTVVSFLLSVAVLFHISWRLVALIATDVHGPGPVIICYTQNIMWLVIM